MKKRKNSKRKGNVMEREIAKKLSLYLTDGKEENAVWRTSSSGAMATTSFKKGKSSIGLKNQVGDLNQTIPKGHYEKLDHFFDSFFVETKFLKSLDLTPNYTKEFQKIMSQLLREKQESGKNIFFVLKRNQREVLVISDMASLTEMKLSFLYENQYFNVYYFEDFLKGV